MGSTNDYLSDGSYYYRYAEWWTECTTIPYGFPECFFCLLWMGHVEYVIQILGCTPHGNVTWTQKGKLLKLYSFQKHGHFKMLQVFKRKFSENLLNLLATVNKTFCTYLKSLSGMKTNSVQSSCSKCHVHINEKHKISILTEAGSQF